MSLLVICLAGCQNTRHDIEKEVRIPSQHGQSVIDVAPMLPEAVKVLLKEAETHKQNGDFNLAIMTIDRALRIVPDSPSVQQHLAEMYLADGDYELAMLWAKKVMVNGPAFGVLCERARRTVALSAEVLGEKEQQLHALETIAGCVQQAKPRY